MSTFFKLIHEDSDSKARAGVISTSFANIPTPVFMPVGTNATVKAVEQRELCEAGAQIILGNTYHLYLRPGDDVINSFGGLHKFMNWNRAILTDSGGYQVFSLKDIRKITDDGVEFKSHIDGSKHFFSPEVVVDIQRNLGSDIMMVLDECAPYPADKSYVRNSMNLSLDWAERSIRYFRDLTPKYNNRQYLFGIAQGGMYNELRIEYLRKMNDMDFDGNAIGGLSVGEPNELMYDITDLSTDILPKEKPRYLMGVGTPQDLLECIERGIDMFDCVMPTRNARNGQLFTTRGKINIKNAKYKLADEPIDAEIDSYASRNFSLGYLRHLFIADEILGLQLASLHNVSFYLWLVRQARENIINGTYKLWKNEFLYKYLNTQVD
jgi:queuine tRNA-ribosyltransferase